MYKVSTNSNFVLDIVLTLRYTYVNDKPETAQEGKEDTMTKREIISYIVDKLGEMWETYPLPTDYDKRHEAYAALKRKAAAYGYTGVAFTQLYNQACDTRARRMGIQGDDGKP